MQVAAVREEAVTELSKHIKQAQRLEELREADAVGLYIYIAVYATHTVQSLPTCQSWGLS